MYVRPVEYLERNNLYAGEYHGFRADKSVITASIDLIESFNLRQYLIQLTR